MCSKILLAVPIMLPRKCCVEVTVLKLIFGVPELYYTFCFLVSPLSGQVKPPSFSLYRELETSIIMLRLLTAVTIDCIKSIFVL